MRKADIDRVVAQLRSAEAAYEEARRQRDEAVIKMARVDGLNNREIAARRAHGGARSADPQERRLAAAAILTSFRKRGALSLRAAYREGLRGSREGSIPRADGDQPEHRAKPD
jgi:hypothetical protein